MDVKAKISQFEGGPGIIVNGNFPINVFIDCRQLIVEYDGQTKFSTKHLSIPLKNVDWRTVKVTVNGVSFYENKSFTREDDGILTWIDTRFILRQNDIFFVEWTVDGANLDPFDIDDIENLLFIIVDNRFVVVEKDNKTYPLIINK